MKQDSVANYTTQFISHYSSGSWDLLTASEMYRRYSPSEWKAVGVSESSLLKAVGKSKSRREIKRHRPSTGQQQQQQDQCISRMLPDFCQVGKVRVDLGQDPAGEGRGSGSRSFHQALRTQRPWRLDGLQRKWSHLPTNSAERLALWLLDQGVYRMVFSGGRDDPLSRQGFEFFLCDLLRTASRLRLAPLFENPRLLRRTLAHDSRVLLSFHVHFPGSPLHQELFQLLYLRNREPYQSYFHADRRHCISYRVISNENYEYTYGRLVGMDEWFPGRQSLEYPLSETYNLTIRHESGTVKVKELVLYNTNGWSRTQAAAMEHCRRFSSVRHVLLPRLNALLRFAKEFPRKFVLFRESSHFLGDLSNHSDNPGLVANPPQQPRTGLAHSVFHSLAPDTWYRYVGFVDVEICGQVSCCAQRHCSHPANIRAWPRPWPWPWRWA